MRLTDKQRKKMIADYVECGSYRQIAKRYGVSATTVKNAVMGDQKSVRKCAQKKEENTADILAYMESQKDKVCSLIGTYLDAMTSKEKIDAATLNQLSTALGTVIDKFTMQNSKSSEERLSETLDKMAEAFGNEPCNGK